jgi:predicted small lipoprotein YifL
MKRIVVGMVCVFAACGAPKGPAKLPPDRKPRIECPPNPAIRPAATSGETMPGKLSKDDVSNAMTAVKARVTACSDTYSRESALYVSCEVGADGGVIWAEATGKWAGTWTGYCVAKAVCGAVFPVSKTSMPLMYPYTL